MNDKEWKDYELKLGAKYKPKTTKELAEYIDKTLDVPFDYDETVNGGTKCLMALWNYLMDKQGHSGFSASCVGLDFLMLTRYAKHGFFILEPDNFELPQYDMKKEIDEYINSEDRCKERLERLPKEIKEGAHPDVKRYWQDIIDNKGRVMWNK